MSALRTSELGNGGGQAPISSQDQGLLLLRPTKRMRAFGFKLQCLGKNDVPAKQAAIAWNDKWDRVRKGDAVSFDDTTVIYPEGTIGEAYQRIMNLRKAARESKGAVWTTDNQVATTGRELGVGSARCSGT